MINTILATAELMANPPESYKSGSMGGFYIMYGIMVLVAIAFWGLIIYGLIQLIRFLTSARKEQKLIRMELGKLAYELEQMRKERKGD